MNKINSKIFESLWEWQNLMEIPSIYELSFDVHMKFESVELNRFKSYLLKKVTQEKILKKIEYEKNS